MTCMGIYIIDCCLNRTRLYEQGKFGVMISINNDLWQNLEFFKCLYLHVITAVELKDKNSVQFSFQIIDLIMSQ